MVEKFPTSAEGTTVPMPYFNTLIVLEMARWALTYHYEEVAEHLDLGNGILEEIHISLGKALAEGDE